MRWNPRDKEGYTRDARHAAVPELGLENVHFVTLDSTVLLEHWGHISKAAELVEGPGEEIGPDRQVIIGFHHGSARVQADGQRAWRLADVVGRTTSCWLRGHGHSDAHWNANGVPATMVAGLYQGSYDIIRVGAMS